MDAVNLSELEAIARGKLTESAYGYIAGGADDEITLRENVAAYRRIALRPRTLVDVSEIDTSVELLGARSSSPILLAPTAFQRLAHPDGELATSRAAAQAGTINVVSTLSSYRLEEIAEAASGPKWFQLYCYKDRSVTEQLVRRAASSGFLAICLTVDVPRIGRRERDVHHRAALPPDTYPRNFEDIVDFDSIPLAERGSAIAHFVTSILDDSLTWDDVDWLRSITELPVLLKGIMTPEDARKAVDRGPGALFKRPSRS